MSRGNVVVGADQRLEQFASAGAVFRRNNAWVYAESLALLVTLADRPIFAATVPNKVQAYMAAGRPIIACLNGEGARLVVEAGAGLATPAEDARALADTILRLYALSPAEQKNMGDNGRRYYQKHFDHDRLTDELIGHLRTISQTYKDIQ